MGKTERPVSVKLPMTYREYGIRVGTDGTVLNLGPDRAGAEDVASHGPDVEAVFRSVSQWLPVAEAG